MFMPKQPISVTLEEANLLWLRGRAARARRRSLSQALDDVVTEMRLGGVAGERRSVAGTIDISADDPDLSGADVYLRSLYETSLARPMVVREEAHPYGSAAGRRRKPRRG